MQDPRADPGTSKAQHLEKDQALMSLGNRIATSTIARPRADPIKREGTQNLESDNEGDYSYTKR
jgi:hypothetical protein